jgi:Outer membrane protein beta-barrel domain
MNKQICFLAILILVTFSGFNVNAQQIYIGPRFGANIANWSGNSPYSGTSFLINIGFLAGGQFEYVFNSTWTFNCQVLYDQKGTSEYFLSTTDVGLPVFRFNYLEIPILLKADFGSGDIRPYIFAGPSLGIYLSGNERFGYGSSYTQSIPDSIVRSSDISAVLGAGLSLQLSRGQNAIY